MLPRKRTKTLARDPPVKKVLTPCKRHITLTVWRLARGPPLLRKETVMQDRAAKVAIAPGEAADAARMLRLGLLQVGEGCVVSPLAVFIPADPQGTIRPVELG